MYFSHSALASSLPLDDVVTFDDDDAVVLDDDAVVLEVLE